MSGALRELLALFDIKVQSDELENADKKVEGFSEKLKKVGEYAAEAFAIEKVGEFFASAVEGAAHMQDLADRLDVSATAITRFGFLAKSAGVDVETAAHSLGILERNMGLAMHGSQEQAQGFRQLGVHLKDAEGRARPFEEVLGDVAEGLAKLPDQQTRAAVGSKVFGREVQALLPIFAKGREGIEELIGEAKDLGVGMGPDFYKQAKAVREEFEHFTAALGALKDRALAVVLPYLDKLGGYLEDLGKWLVEATKHTTILQSALTVLAGLIGFLMVRAVVALLAALAPFAIPIAIVAALFVVFDDLFALFTGGKSVIGDLIDELFGLGTAKKFVEDMTEAFDDTLDVAKDLGHMVEQVVVGALEQAFDAAKSLGEALGDIASGNFKAAWNDLKKGGDQMLADAKKRGGNIASDAGAIADDVTLAPEVRKLRRRNARVAAGGEGTIVPEEYGPNTNGTGTREVEHAAIPGHVSNASSQTTQHTENHETNIKVDVHTGSDQPKKVGQEVGQEVGRSVRKEKANTLAARVMP